MGIRPFYYGVKVTSIYEKGEAIDAAVLDISDDQVANHFYVGLRNVAALCFKLEYPSIVCVPHSVLNGYKRTLALGLKLTNYSWPELETVMCYLCCCCCWSLVVFVYFILARRKIFSTIWQKIQTTK